MAGQQQLFNFNRDLEAFSKQMGIDHVTVMKKVAFDLFKRIVQKTPVLTGRARASWNIAIAQPDRTVAGAGIHDEYTSGSGAAQAKAGSVLAKMKAGEYHPIWITNNLPYIEALENGHSDQAPAGMVALSLAETETELDVAMGAAT